jgi:hypothetical protein
MNKLLYILSVSLFITVTTNSQNLFFIGENSYPSSVTCTLHANSYDAEDLDVVLARDGETGLFVVITESNFGENFSEKLIIYLEDGTVISCNKRTASDYIDGKAKAVYSLTGEQLKSLMNSNIHTVRYTLEIESDRGLISNMKWNWSATNKGIQTKNLISDFWEGKIKNSGDYRLTKENTQGWISKEEERLADIRRRTHNALSSTGGSGTGTNQGIAGGEGNQGVETGAVGANKYGEGGGTGNEGISYDLAGRQAQSLLKPKYDIESEGIVVVEITVDRNGNVTKATPGVKGSTTLEEYFLRVARETALTAKFDRKPDAPVIQKGTITYHFIMR